jgi:L-serine kinase (ATP) / ParB family transcriptional regulator, heme-responsive regulator
MHGPTATDENGPLRIGELPKLHIVDLDEVVLHEDPDMERVARLVDRFSADGVLKNPPVVGRSGPHRRIVLDGANRVTALRKLGYPHVLVQELDLQDPGLSLATWHHAIERLTAEQLLGHARSVDGLSLVEAAGGGSISPPVIARFRFPDGRSVALHGAAELRDWVAQLHQVTRAYHRFAYFDRVSYTSMEDLARNYDAFTALISFRPFSLEDLKNLTSSDRRVPSGVTRVLLPKRALRFNLQLEMLRAGLSLEEKESWLQQTILEKVADKSIRFYREPTFFFDE